LRYLYDNYNGDNLSHRARTVYNYLQDMANREHLCWPSLRTISTDLALSKSTVKRAIQDLKEAGYLRTEQRWRTNGGKSSLLFRLLR